MKRLNVWVRIPPSRQYTRPASRPDAPIYLNARRARTLQAISFAAARPSVGRIREVLAVQRLRRRSAMARSISTVFTIKLRGVPDGALTNGQFRRSVALDLDLIGPFCALRRCRTRSACASGCPFRPRTPSPDAAPSPKQVGTAVDSVGRETPSTGRLQRGIDCAPGVLRLRRHHVALRAGGCGYTRLPAALSLIPPPLPFTRVVLGRAVLQR